jgi:hypothetical protein
MAKFTKCLNLTLQAGSILSKRITFFRLKMLERHVRNLVMEVVCTLISFEMQVYE